MQITQWHPGNTKPVRDGVYRRLYPHGWSYCKFENGKWKYPADTIEVAQIQRFNSWLQDDIKWCGVTKP